MSSVNKKFPKMDLFKLVYLGDLLWVSIYQGTESCISLSLPCVFKKYWKYSSILTACRKALADFPLSNPRGMHGRKNWVNIPFHNNFRQFEGVSMGFFHCCRALEHDRLTDTELRSMKMELSR